MKNAIIIKSERKIEKKKKKNRWERFTKRRDWITSKKNKNLKAFCTEYILNVCMYRVVLSLSGSMYWTISFLFGITRCVCVRESVLAEANFIE